MQSHPSLYFFALHSHSQLTDAYRAEIKTENENETEEAIRR